jgi:hypothetical protein
MKDFRPPDYPDVSRADWLIFNTHGLDDEGWGPIRSSDRERLLDRLLAIETLAIVPAGKALAELASAPSCTPTTSMQKF